MSAYHEGQRTSTTGVHLHDVLHHWDCERKSFPRPCPSTADEVTAIKCRPHDCSLDGEERLDALVLYGINGLLGEIPLGVGHLHTRPQLRIADRYLNWLCGGQQGST